MEMQIHPLYLRLCAECGKVYSCGNRNGIGHASAARTSSRHSARMDKLSPTAIKCPRVLISGLISVDHGQVWFELCQGGECVQLGLVPGAKARPGRRGHAGKGCARRAHGQAWPVTQASADKVPGSEVARHTKESQLHCKGTSRERPIHTPLPGTSQPGRKVHVSQEHFWVTFDSPGCLQSHSSSVTHGPARHGVDSAPASATSHTQPAPNGVDSCLAH